MKTFALSKILQRKSSLIWPCSVKNMHTSLLLMLLAGASLSSFFVMSASATDTTVRVNPENAVVCKYDVFTVNITLLDVSNMVGWEFKVYWNRTVVNCTGTEIVGPSEWSELNMTFGPGLQPNYNASHGRYWKGFTYLYPASTFNGSTALATLTFKALKVGTALLDVVDVKLADNHQPLPNAINHTDTDGYVTVVPSPLYMRSDQHTMNNATMFKLMETHTDNYSKTSISCVDPENEYPGSWGVRVWKRSNETTETELTSGSPVAVVVRYSGQGLQSANWTCPATNMSLTDCLVIRVYYGLSEEPDTLSAEFISVQLNATSLTSQTWTIHYYTKRSYNAPTHITTISYYWDNTYNSRIENVDYN